MQENSNNFSEAMRLAESPAGKLLLERLRQQGGSSLEDAIGNAASGDYRGLQSMLRTLLSDPEAQRLLRQLGG